MKKALLLLPLFILACTSQEVSYEKSTGKINKIRSGDRFHINLSEEHKVGKGLWSIGNSADNNIVEYQGSVFRSDAGGVDFNFKALAKGQTEIQFAQSYARDTIQKMTFIVEVE